MGSPAPLQNGGASPTIPVAEEYQVWHLRFWSPEYISFLMIGRTSNHGPLDMFATGPAQAKVCPKSSQTNLADSNRDNQGLGGDDAARLAWVAMRLSKAMVIS